MVAKKKTSTVEAAARRDEATDKSSGEVKDGDDLSGDYKVKRAMLTAFGGEITRGTLITAVPSPFGTKGSYLIKDSQGNALGPVCARALVIDCERQETGCLI